MENLYGESLERDSDDGLAPIEGVPPPLPLLLLLLLSNLRIYLSVDNNVVLDEVRRLADGWQRAVLVVVCVRLGTRHINKVVLLAALLEQQRFFLTDLLYICFCNF